MSNQQTVLGSEEISPSMVDPSFCETCFKKRQIEEFLEHLVRFQQKRNPNKWTAFTQQQLAESLGFQDSLPPSEASILEALIYGGRPVPCPTVLVSPGYIGYDDSLYYLQPALIRVFIPFLRKAPIAA